MRPIITGESNMFKKPNCPVIAIEEHYWDAELVAQFKGIEASRNDEISKRLQDFGDMRIKEMDEAGIDVQVVPYRGAAEAAVGVMRGDSHMALNAYSAVLGQVKAGQLRAMAVAALHRSPSTPSDLPLLNDVGLKGFELINVGVDKMDAFLKERAAAYMISARRLGLVK